MKRFIITIVSILCTLSLSAQNTYIEVKGGVSSLTSMAPFASSLAPVGSVSIGTGLSGGFSARLDATVGRSWASAGSSIYGKGYAQCNLDAVIDITSLLGSASPWRAYAFAGLGANFRWTPDGQDFSEASAFNRSHGETTDLYIAPCSILSICGRAGLGTSIALTEHFALTAEVSSTVLSDKYNSLRDHAADYQTALTVGLRYSFGGRKTRRTSTVATAPVAVPAPRRDTLRLASTVTAAPAKAVDDKPLVDAELFAFRPYFSIGSAELSSAEKRRLSEAARLLHDRGYSKVTLTGYADKETGNPTLNWNLSEKRARTVENFLAAYGITRVETQWRGDTEKVDPIQELNRTVIISVAR